MKNHPKNHNPIQNRAPSQPEPVIPDTNPASPRETQANAEPFGPVIYRYSRKQALADAVQMEVTRMARCAGFKVAVFVTAAVFHRYIKFPGGEMGPYHIERLWSLFRALRYAIRYHSGNVPYLEFQFSCPKVGGQPRQLVTLAAECGARDFDDPRAAITIMLLHED